MAKQGQKLDPALKEQIKAYLATCDNVRETARKFNVSDSTVRAIRDEKPDEFAQLRADKKEIVVSKIWDGFVNGVTLGNKMIEEALEGRRDIPLNQLSTYNGTMFDKHALMTGGKTANVGVKLEDFFS